MKRILPLLLCLCAQSAHGQQFEQLAKTQTVGPFRADLTIRADQPRGAINKNIYGQFAEHLGRLIYEGLWVGEGSPIPNTRGIRNDVLAALKELRVPVLRWPGGCFADEYHWRDGIGPRGQRPRRPNASWGGVDTNVFGTHEFLELCEMLGADAYINGNVGSGTPQEMMDWIEYMTSDSDSTLADLRRRNGRARAWKVPYFAVGNETWGCGGQMRPEFYADVYRQYATFIKNHSGNRVEKLAVGASDDNYHWTEVLMSQASKQMDGLSLHYYTLPTSDWEKKGSATEFGEKDWHATLIPVELAAPEYKLGEASVPTLNASASRDAAGALHLSLVNLDPNRAAQVSLKIAGTSPAKLTGRVLTAPAMNATNTFERPDAVRPAPFTDFKTQGGVTTLSLPPKSVVVLELR